MYIFGKFDAFCKRIQKVIDMFNVIEKFSMLEKIGVEGMDSLNKRFLTIVNQMQRKPYDILDHRKMVRINFSTLAVLRSNFSFDRNTIRTTPILRSKYPIWKLVYSNSLTLHSSI